MHIQFKTHLLIALCCAMLPVASARPGEPPVLKLKDLISEALERNPGLSAARNEAAGKEARIGPMGAYEDPMIELEAMNYPTDTLSSRDLGMTALQLSVQQVIPFPGKLGKLRLAATHEYQASRQAYSAKQLQVIREVKAAYFELFLAHRKREILQERQNVVRQLIVVTRNKYTLGNAPQAELLAMQVEEANLISQSLVLEKEVQTRSAELAALLGRGEGEVVGRIPMIERTKVDFAELTLEKLTAQALEKSPLLRAAEAEQRVAQARHSYSKWSYLPDFTLTFRYGFRQPNMDDRGVDTVSAGIGLTLPIWALTKQSQEAKASGAEEVRADAMLSERRNELVRQVRAAYADLTEARKKIDLFEGALLPLTRQAVATGRSAYLVRKLEYVALLGSINTRYQTEQDYYETLARFETKLAEIEGIVGESLGESLGASGGASK